MEAEMPSEEPSFTEETASNMLKELQSWWEIPSMAQYISLFREAFNLPEIEIEELESALIDDCVKGPNEWLENLIIAFLKSIMPNRVNPTNWELQLKRLIKRKWAETPYAEGENPLTSDDKSFHNLDLRSKVEIIYSFCLYRLDNNDIGEAMKSMDADALRVQKLGVDDARNTYWYFYGTRLYKEEPLEEKKTWDEEWKEQKSKSMRKKRGRGRPPKKKNVENDDVEETPKEDERFMNVSEKSRWSVACDTLEEWVNFAEKFKNSKSKNEKSLFEIISENFLPTLSKIYEEKERKLQEKIKELLPTREKIVTRRETRRMRGEPGRDVNYALLNGYDSDEEDFRRNNDYSMLREVKSRAERLEERNKRASEIGTIHDMAAYKRMKHDDENKRSSESSENSSESGDVDVKSQMIKLLSNVKLHKDAWPFIYPVDENDAPGYYEIIKDPVDLTTIGKRLHNGEYETVGDLDADFSRMVSNCELYNGENHSFSKMAQTLRIFFRKEISDLLEMMEEAAESSNANSEESNDSQYNSSSNSNASSPPHESHVTESKEHKKKDKKKKKRHGKNMEALDMLAQATENSVQDNITDNPSSSQKVSPVPQDTRPAPCYTNQSPLEKVSSVHQDTRPAPCYANPSPPEKVSPIRQDTRPAPSYENQSPPEKVSPVRQDTRPAPCYANQPPLQKVSPAIQDTRPSPCYANPSPPQKVSPALQDTRPSPCYASPSPPQKVSSAQDTRPAPCYVPSANKPCYAPSSSNPTTKKTFIPITFSNIISVNTVPVNSSSFISANSSPQGSVPVTSSSFISTNSSSQASVPVTSSTFISVNSSPQRAVPVTSPSFITVNSSPRAAVRSKPVIVRTKAANVNKINSIFDSFAANSLNTASDKSSNVSMQQTNVNQPFQTVVLARPPVNQGDLKLQNNPMTATSMQSNICLPNGLPVVQQVVLPPGTQLPNTGQQYIIASPQNTFRLISKDQTVQLQNSVGQLNQGFVKVVPQMIPPTMQISKDGNIQSFQIQTLSPNSNQAFTQVAQNPQFVSVPQYVVSNQNSMTNSTSQPTVNYQSFQIPTRPMHIGGQGNG